MASSLVNFAVASVKPPHASYYGSIDDSNPVVSAANKELKEIMAYFSKKASGIVATGEACSRGPNWLFDVWNKYEPRFPPLFFFKKLVSMGDFLVDVGAYDVASSQCYRRYLVTRYNEVPADHFEDPQSYKQNFFKAKEKEDDHVLTAKALLGMYIADYSSICVRDPNMLDTESVPQCILILKGIQTLMQCLMVNESFCWLVYNCTIIIYTICRSLMTANYSIKAVDYLLWASMCMESIVPLLGVKYLEWRVTLYSAVCMAYYDCKAGFHAENFARRGLSKLQELNELERLSDSSYSIETQCIFRQATAKMASMVFKRTVYETRRKQKGVLRPKVRPTMKDMAQMPWPRSVTEKLLTDMFEGSAAQFLAILEALTSSHRRTFHNAPYSTEPELVEVAAELFYAGKEIIAGGGGTGNAVASGADHSVLAGVQNNASLIELAAAGLDGVTLSSVVRFIKLAFCYDMWTIFDSMLDCALIYVKKNSDQEVDQGQVPGHSGTELCLALMLVMQRVTRQQSGRKSAMLPGAEDPNERVSVQTMTTSSPNVQINDDLVNLAETVLYCINEPDVFKPQGLDGEILIDKDMIMDAALILWQKCKQVLGKLPSSSKKDFGSALLKTGDPDRWLHILTVVHTALLWCDVGLVDPTVIAEVSLRLAASLESAATTTDSMGSRASDIRGPSRMTVYSTTLISPNAQLVKSLSVLKTGLKVISDGRSNDAMNDGKSVADTLWMNRAEQLAECKISTSNAFIRDLIVEMLVVYYRVSFRLVEKTEPKLATTRSRFNTPRATPSKPAATVGEQPVVLTEQKIKETVGGSLLCRAIYLMEKANQPGVSHSQAEKLLEKSMKAIEDAQEEEKRLFEESWMQLNNPYDCSDQTDLPPPPILLCRSSTSMIFKPAPFEPERDQVAWYKIFGRLAAGPNVKVRLNDYYLPGTGDEVPAGKDCILRVSGLKRNLRYLFAVAAYNKEGKLIGGAVGKTGNSIVASHPLSCLAAWGHLAHMSHKLECPTISKKACSVLWDIFVASPSDPPKMSWTSNARQDYEFTVHHLNREVAMESSPVLLHHAVTAVFVAVEVAVREKELFCDKFCEEGPILESQLSRLKECERMLVAIEMAGWLNDTSLVLQAVVQTYGLIAPIIQAEITAMPILQVCLRCICALMETRPLLKQKRSGNTTDSLNHMVAVLTNYIAALAKIKGSSQAALATIDNGKNLLRGDSVALHGRKQSMEQHSGKKPRTKKAGSTELLNEKSVSSLAELAALEERLADLAKDVRLPDEMSGLEDGNMVAARLAKMRCIIGFREVPKFKRRNRYLEFFVIILRKALKTLTTELAVECSQDVMATLHRRNEILSVNQAVVSKQQGGVAVQGTESKKYAAAVAEYTKDGKKGKKGASPKPKPDKPKKSSSKLKGKKSSNLGEDQEEIARKNAMITIANNLGRCFRNYQKRKKFRKVLNDEAALKSEFHMINGLLYFNLFMEQVKERRFARGFKLPAHANFEFLDQEWWSLNTSGALVVGWDDGIRSSAEVGNAAKDENRRHADRALEKSAYVAISATLVSDANKAQSPILEEERKLETPRTFQTRSTAASSPVADQEAWVALDMETFLPPIKLSLLCFQRAMVLAYRGKRWTLLQNAASNFYSVAMSALQVACDGTEPQFTLKECRELLRLPMSIAAEVLIGMLMAIDDGQGDGAWLYHSAVGERKAKKGGLSLKFEKPTDDVGFINTYLIKKIVLQAIQILHYCTRYEQLIDLCFRFSEVTHDCYYDVISPIVIHAQSKLGERISAFSGTPHPQPHMLDAAKRLGKSQVENRDYLRYDIKVKSPDAKQSVDVGGFIDPESHDVYSGGQRALALSSVPFDPNHSMEKLKEAFHCSQYMTRSLQYSRRMLLIYLASQHNAAASIKKGGGKKASESANGSCVEFSFKADESHPPAPPDLTRIDFTSTDGVEILASPQSSTVVQAYNRTIELLQSHGEHDLVSQAANELANLYLHLGNTKLAFKWWKYSLDQVLRTKNCLSEWRKPFEHDENAPEELLAICGVWGCLHAINVACKIGEFSSPDTSVRTECALLSTALIRAIFRSSMPHPSADFNYATYEILPSSFQTALLTQSKAKVNLTNSHLLANTLLAGVDFSSDSFRLDVPGLLASLHWLSDYLVQMKFHLQVLPATVLYQYFATFICRDTERSAHCRCIKLTALTELRMFKEASDEIMNLLCGFKLPHSVDVAYAPAENFPVPNMFDVSKPIDDPDNLKIMEIIAGKRISGQLAQVYGPHLTCEITLCQANLLVELAACISCIPQKPTLQDLEFVSPELPEQSPTKKAPSSLSPSKMKRRQSSSMYDDTRSTISTLSSLGGAKNVNKLFTKRERPMGLQLLKGMLLAVADNLVTTLAKPLQSSNETLLASEVWFYVKCLDVLSEIQLQRQLSTLSAAKALHALTVLQEASVFDEQFELKSKKPRSAIRNKKVDEENKPNSDYKTDFYPVIEHMYRSRLNARLWLDCRLKMCQALASQVKGLGKIEENLPKNTGLLDHSQVQLYCAEGLAESEACNDVEMQALFLILGASLDGITSNESKHMLEDATTSLDEQAELSSRAVEALVQSTIILADLSLASGSTGLADSLQSYRSAQSVLLLKVMQEGEEIRHRQVGSDLSGLEEAPSNIYSTTLLLLAQIKLRIARSLAQTLEYDRVDQDCSVLAQILTQAENLCSISACASPLLLAEINLELGKVQKLLFGGNIVPIKLPIFALKKSITLAEENGCNLPLIRQAHLESALLHLLNIDQQTRAITAPTNLERATTSFPTIKDENVEGVNLTSRSYSLDCGVVSQPLEVTNSRDCIAASLHTCYYAARGVRQRSILPGDPKVTSVGLNTDDKAALPDFLVLDLASDYSIFPNTVVTGEDTYDPIVASLKMTTTKISWVHIFMYNVLLKRKSRLSTSYARENTLDLFSQNQAGSNVLSPQNEGRSACVWTPLKSRDIFIRLSALHQFLTRHPSYVTSGNIPPVPLDTSFVVSQWHWSDDRSSVQLVWCVHRKDGTADCGRVQVNTKMLESVTKQAIETKKRTDEYFARKAPAAAVGTTPRRRSRAKSIQIDPQLEEDWTHVVNQIINLLSNQDEPITSLPFPVTLITAESIVEFFNIGCFFDASHLLFNWMSKLLCPV